MHLERNQDALQFVARVNDRMVIVQQVEKSDAAHGRGGKLASEQRADNVCLRICMTVIRNE